MLALLALLALQYDDPKADPNALPWVADGVRISVFAKEPLVRNPAALAFDARGRLFVGGGPQYRHPREDTPGDAVVLLADTDGDGTADRSQVFAKGFNSIQGLAWRGRDLWVANAPDLTIVRDLDGDDEADEYVLVATGLGTLEHGLHGLTWGPDGRLFMSKGDTPVQPWAPKPFRDLSHTAEEGPAPVALGAFRKDTYKKTFVVPMDGHTEGGVLRYDPRTSSFEIVCRGLRNPWDIAFDTGFHWLGTDNDDVGGDRIFMPFPGAHFGSRHPWSNSWTGANHLPTVPVSGPTFEGSGVGIVHLSGPGIPEAYRRTFLIGDWHLKKIYVYRPTWNGALRQADGGKLEELVRGDKSLFRPTDLELGPDGAVYVGGWGTTYGARWKGKELENEGRIFKIVLPSTPAVARRPEPLERRTVAQLVEDLGSHFPAGRLAAQDELLRRGEPALKELRALLESGALEEGPETWALWTLARGGAMPPGPGKTLNQRIQSIRIQAPSASVSVIDLLRDPEPRIRLEAAIAIRERRVPCPQAVQEALRVETDRLCTYALWRALKELMPAPARKELLRHQEPALRLAALLGLLEDAALEGAQVLALSKDADPRVAGLAGQWLGKVGYGLDDPGAVLAQLQKLDHRHVNYELRLNLLRTLSRMTLEGPQWDQLHQSYYKAWRRRNDEVVPEEKSLEIAEALNILTKDVRGLPVLWDALDHDWAQVRVAAADLLPRAAGDGRAFLLERLPEAKGRRLEAAVQAIKGFDRKPWTPKAPALKSLAAAYEQEGDPAGRRAILELLTDVASWEDASIPEKIARQAAQDPDPRVHSAVPALAGKLNLTISTSNREPATIDAVLSALPKADPKKGAELFRSKSTSCSVCHRIGGEGRAIGPDLTDLATRQEPRAIIESILRPSATIIEGFRVTRIRTRDGRVLDGLAHDETDGSLKLFQADGRDLSLEKKEIDARKVSDVSLMPDGYDRILGAADVADLVAWLRTLKKPTTVELRAAGKPVATFHAQHPQILRPFLADLRGPDGTALTRTFPPVEGRDAVDHAAMHPGLWLGFGDLGGSDFWRNKGRIEHVRFDGDPRADGLTQVARLLVKDRVVCTQTLRVRVEPASIGSLILLDAAYRSEDADFSFGDQEEMGLGVRMATPLTVKAGGRMIDSEGRVNEKEIWGKAAAWCDASAAVEGRTTGITVLPAPSNFRPCWWHVRDYGVLVANPFGRAAMKQGAASRVDVRKGETFRLRFGVLLHAGVGTDSPEFKSAVAASLEKLKGE